MSKSGDINAQNLFRPTLCTHCGYSLEGLPSSGRCPECGSEYSPERLVLFGRGQGAAKTFAAPSALMMLAYCFLIGGYIAYTHFFPRRYAGHLQWIFIAWIFGRQLWQRYIARSEMPAEAHVQLSPAGFGLRDGFGEVDIEPWRPKHRVSIREAAHNSYRLKIRVPLMQFVSSHPLDFTFDADEATALRVAERIEQFRNRRKVERDFALNEVEQRQ